MKQFLLNGRIMLTADVLSCDPMEQGQTRFESNLFDFIQKWHSGDRVFHITTSGSTGKPAAIAVTRRQMIASAKATLKTFDLRPGDSALLCLDPAYIAGMMMIVRAIEGGLDLIAVEPSANPFEPLNEKDQPDFAAMVPYQLKGVLNGPPQRLDILYRLRALLLGGGPVDAALEKEIKKMKTPVYLGFGMTETVSHIALRRLNGSEASEVYKILPGIAIKTDRRGCLCAKGAVTNHKWVITNDRIELTGENTFIWKGRADHVINSGGVKIHPEEIEGQIAEYFREKGVDCKFFVAGLPDPRTGQRLCLIMEGKPQDQNWIAELKNLLPEYKNPKEVLFTEQFIYTDTGKIQREKTMGVLSSKE